MVTRHRDRRTYRFRHTRYKQQLLDTKTVPVRKLFSKNLLTNKLNVQYFVSYDVLLMGSIAMELVMVVMPSQK